MIFKFTFPKNHINMLTQVHKDIGEVGTNIHQLLSKVKLHSLLSKAGFLSVEGKFSSKLAPKVWYIML